MNLTPTKTTRPRGFADYEPQAKAMDLIRNAQQVLHENAEYLPLTLRQIFYRLVVKGQIEKTEKGYKNLCEKMNRARRAKMISMNDIRDDGFSGELWTGYNDVTDCMDTLRWTAENLQLDLQNWQEVRLVVWCEAGGMVPQLEAVTKQYSIPVVSSGGFDSVTAKHDMAVKLSKGPHHILHIGDFDPSGVHIASSLDEDLTAFAGGGIGFSRIAVTEEQGDTYSLPTAPPKKTDNRSFSGKATIQAEALPPETLAQILDDAIRSHIDTNALRNAKAEQADARLELVERLFPSEI